MAKTTHEWYIAFTKSALQQLRELPSNVRMAVFSSLRVLLRLQNPLAATNVVWVKNEEFDSYRVYRFRKGDYRVKFYIISQEITHENHTYRGTLIVVAAEHRKRAYRP